MKEIVKENIKIECSDKVLIVGTLYFPTNKLKAARMLAPATGIKRRFYNSFATFLAGNGFAVITFDNRGIGDSLDGHVKNFKASIQDWGELDMTAVFECLKKKFPNCEYHLVGHSAGGQLIGLMPNTNELSSVLNFASSSGRIKNMSFPFSLTVSFFMQIFIPVNNFLFGYTNTQWMGMGEPLPKNAASQWRKWCSGKGYVQTDFGKAIKTHYYDSVDMPSLWLNATDDDIANDKNVADMLQVFPKLNAKTKTLNPKEYDLKEIGHMKFFSKKNKVLWKLVLDWLEGGYKG